MADAERIYSDDEFALILRKTAELASRVEPSGSSSGGLTLSEMKAAAAQQYSEWLEQFVNEQQRGLRCHQGDFATEGLGHLEAFPIG